tara:strand:+ start:1288 stop:2241 length:954 start_codon:yes stop_codon:yes gene_type:complete
MVSYSKNKPLNMPSSNTLITTKKFIGIQKSKRNAYGMFPSFRRPNTNGVNNNIDINDYYSPFGTARPMKQWRKQLDPVIELKDGDLYSSGKSNAQVLYSDIPGGKIYTDNVVLDAQYEIEESFENKNNNMCLNQSKKYHNNGYIQVGAVGDPDSYRIQTGVYNTRCVAGNPEAQIIKPASTIVSKAYYSDTKGYLQSRCKTYNQKQSHYTPNGKRNEDNEYRMTDCPKTGKDCVVTTVYKPNNQTFQTQGAVSSSLRTQQLNNDTRKTNGASFTSAYGKQAANAGKYSRNGNGPYFVKSKEQKPICIRRNGNKTLCF